MTFAMIKIKALTFIELLLVIIIIGILTGVSIPQLRKAFDNFALENFAKDIYYLSRYLQGSAIAGGKIYYLNINKDKGEFQATYKEENEFKNIQGRFGKIYKALDGIIVSLEPSERTGVYFYPDGSMDKIRITLENQYKKQLSIITKGVAGEIQIQ